MTQGIKFDKVDEKIIIGAIADSDELRAEITQQVHRIRNKANASLTQRQSYPDYESSLHTHRDGTPGGTVYTRSNHAKYAEAKRNTLVRLLSGATIGGSAPEGKRERRARQAAQKRVSDRAKRRKRGK